MRNSVLKEWTPSSTVLLICWELIKHETWWQRRLTSLNNPRKRKLTFPGKNDIMAGGEDDRQQEPQGPAGQADNHVDRGAQTKLPPPLTLEGNKLQQWKLFKKRWNNYMILTNFETRKREFQIARLENCLADDALELLEGFNFNTPENERTVQEILTAFERYCQGETNETMERYNFAKRDQKEGESFDKFLADLRILIKTCGYCAECTPKILSDRIILGITSDETREDLLKERKLTIDQCVDICRAHECAAAQTKCLKTETVNQIKKSEGGQIEKRTEERKMQMLWDRACIRQIRMPSMGYRMLILW